MSWLDIALLASIAVVLILIDFISKQIVERRNGARDVRPTRTEKTFTR